MQQLAVSKENCNGLQNWYSIPGRSMDFLFANPSRQVEDIKAHTAHSWRPFAAMRTACKAVYLLTCGTE